MLQRNMQSTTIFIMIVKLAINNGISFHYCVNVVAGFFLTSKKDAWVFPCDKLVSPPFYKDLLSKYT